MSERIPSSDRREGKRVSERIPSSDRREGRRVSELIPSSDRREGRRVSELTEFNLLEFVCLIVSSTSPPLP